MHTRLGSFIRANVEPIVDDWSSFARSRAPAGGNLTALALRDHIEPLLAFIANDLESPQTSSEQLRKSHGGGPREGGDALSAAEIHAVLRLNDGFDINQMVSEYRALRASVVNLWRASSDDFDVDDFDELNRFHESIDQVATESIAYYSEMVARSRTLFLGILGHDLRDPIRAAKTLAELMVTTCDLTSEQSGVADQIILCTHRAKLILEDLLDLTRLQLGSEIPISRAPMEMGALGDQLVREMRALHPERRIVLYVSGDTAGQWDCSRMGQVVANLIGNAIAHGSGRAPVNVTIEGDPRDVILSVQNEGPPIPAGKMDSIFDLLVKGRDNNGGEASTHLGLGLYVARNIVVAHGGAIDVTSTSQGGTTFTVKLPRGFPRTDNLPWLSTG